MLLAIGMLAGRQSAVLERDDFFMGLALDEAEKGYQLAEVPVGAVLVGADGQILARAHNMPIMSNDPTAHAEILAIRSGSTRVGNYRLPETVIYVTLEPCAMCVGAMIHGRVKRLVFGARDPRSGAAGSVLDLTGIYRFNHRIDVTGGVLAENCAEILRRFFKERRG
jgi:tRNA(adenine34) deaminase